MVVMQMIGEDYCQLSDFPPPYSHHKDIIQKLALLHQENYVHSDM